MYDLAIALRVCDVPSKNPPPVFADDKFGLVKECFRSLQLSLGDLNVKLFVILTARSPEYENFFRSECDAQIINIGRVGNPASFRRQIQVLLGQTDSEYVYAAEDDYYYLPNQFSEALNFLKSVPNSFVSLYDHPDNYVSPYQTQYNPHSESGNVKVVNNRLWYARAATTLTFLTRKNTLFETQRVFRERHIFGRLVWGSDADTVHWLALTKRRVFNGPLWLKSLRSRPYWAGCVAFAWAYNPRQVLFGRRYKLWTPNPSIATHMLKGEEALEVL